MTKKLTSDQIRQKFLQYFIDNDHTLVESSPLLPQNDPTLLFANAGMNQFKNTFTGVEKLNYTKATSSQKCVRAGGKHNDLENVGYTARHHTFFEMLGNFSFGDYFKKEAIAFSWKFLTEELKIPKDKLYITVHASDDEAEEIWHKQEGVPKDRISHFDEDNFWTMGDTGPCGPCSEIFYDHGAEFDPDGTAIVGGDGDRYIEIWNLVFMQYNQIESTDSNGTKTITRENLPNPSVDTGCGLARLTAVMQGVQNNYDTDIFTDIIKTAETISQLSYKTNDTSKQQMEINAAMRVLADHSRAASFLIADGVLPSNEGRGYVLRRIMRRAIRYGQKLDSNSNDSNKPLNSYLSKMCQTVIEKMLSVYPNLATQQSLIVKTVQSEEERFLTTLNQGTQILEQELDKIQNDKNPLLSGKIAFQLYDTYGFPIDLTTLISNEKKCAVDEKSFHQHMEAAKSKARASWKGSTGNNDEAALITIAQKVQQQHGVTEFLGYESTNNKSEVILLTNDLLVTKSTCFYAESGGQIGDKGTIASSTGKATVTNCIKKNDTFFHFITISDGEITEGQNVELIVDPERRLIAANHSATHLLHAALIHTLGDHVNQSGSLVDAAKLRFDFTHNSPLTEIELNKLEDWINLQISLAQPTSTIVTDPKTAVKEGALALFGEKYGDEVRVVKVGENSTELCGGTHVSNTAMIRLFKIVSETGVSAGIRRIEALTSNNAFDYLNKHSKENNQSRKAINATPTWSSFLTEQEINNPVLEQIKTLKESNKILQKEIHQLKQQKINLDDIVKSAKTFTYTDSDSKKSNGLLLTTQIESNDRKMLSNITDKLKDKIQTGIVVVIGAPDDANNSSPLIIAVSKNLSKTDKAFHAGNLVKAITNELGGKGGGRPDFAQGSIEDNTRLTDGFKAIESCLN